MNSKKKHGAAKMKLESVPVVATARKLEPSKPRSFTCQDPLDPALYTSQAKYSRENVRSVGYTSIKVLPFLSGRLMDTTVLAYVHSLRPSAVRITDGMIKPSSMLWRVTIMVEVVHGRRYVKDIFQEVEVGLPDNIPHSEALGHALLYGILSREAQWHADAEGYVHIGGGVKGAGAGYYKQTTNGAVKWKFRNRKLSSRLWLKRLVDQIRSGRP